MMMTKLYLYNILINTISINLVIIYAKNINTHILLAE